jgi:uncharacterized coiled-coil protein SlyX
MTLEQRIVRMEKQISEINKQLSELSKTLGCFQSEVSSRIDQIAIFINKDLNAG